MHFIGHDFASFGALMAVCCLVGTFFFLSTLLG